MSTVRAGLPLRALLQQLHLIQRVESGLEDVPSQIRAISDVIVVVKSEGLHVGRSMYHRSLPHTFSWNLRV